MQRRKFIKQGCITCLAGIGLSSFLLNSCTVTKHYNATIENDYLLVPLSQFNIENSDKKKSYIIIQNNKLQFPICVYRLDEKNYNALWMRCPHQGAELQVFGDKLQCPAHGSEFDKSGTVQNPPANGNLRTFATTINNNFLHISLK